MFTVPVLAMRIAGGGHGGGRRSGMRRLGLGLSLLRMGLGLSLLLMRGLLRLGLGLSLLTSRLLSLSLSLSLLLTGGLLSLHRLLTRLIGLGPLLLLSLLWTRRLLRLLTLLRGLLTDLVVMGPRLLLSLLRTRRLLRLLTLRGLLGDLAGLGALLLLLGQMSAALAVPLTLLIGGLTLCESLALGLTALVLGQAGVRGRRGLAQLSRGRPDLGRLGLGRLGLGRRGRARSVLAQRSLGLGLADPCVAARRTRTGAHGRRRGVLEVGLPPALEALGGILAAIALGVPARLFDRRMGGVIGLPCALAAAVGRQLRSLRGYLRAGRRPIGRRHAAAVSRAGRL